jgi:hypothetical protein
MNEDILRKKIREDYFSIIHDLGYSFALNLRTSDDVTRGLEKYTDKFLSLISDIRSSDRKNEAFATKRFIEEEVSKARKEGYDEGVREDMVNGLIPLSEEAVKDVVRKNGFTIYNSGFCCLEDEERIKNIAHAICHKFGKEGGVDGGAEERCKILADIQGMTLTCPNETTGVPVSDYEWEGVVGECSDYPGHFEPCLYTQIKELKEGTRVRVQIKVLEEGK